MTSNPSGPPFTVERYGCFGACVVAERDWYRAALERIARFYGTGGDGNACAKIASEALRAAEANNAPNPLMPADETAVQHASDCAVHNEPAFPAGACDCKEE